MLKKWHRELRCGGWRLSRTVGAVSLFSPLGGRGHLGRIYPLISAFETACSEWCDLYGIFSFLFLTVTLWNIIFVIYLSKPDENNEFSLRSLAPACGEFKLGNLLPFFLSSSSYSFFFFFVLFAHSLFPSFYNCFCFF